MEHWKITDSTSKFHFATSFSTPMSSLPSLYVFNMMIVLILHHLSPDHADDNMNGHLKITSLFLLMNLANEKIELKIRRNRNLSSVPF